MRENFDASLSHVLKHEGGYVDHPKDPGGATNRGITRKVLAAWRGISPWWALPKTEVRNLSMAETADIYRAKYWHRVNADRLPGGLDYAVFDFGVNSGPSRAVKYLQAILGVKQDGYVGPVTLGAIENYSLAVLIVKLCDNRMAFLRRLSTWSTFGRGWTSRVNGVRKHAMEMASLHIASGKTPEPLPAGPAPPKPNIITRLLSALFGALGRLWSRKD